METLRYSTLAAWAKDTCDAIREKDGTSGTIDHQDVPDRIRAIPSGGGTNVSGVTAQPENVSENVKFMDANGILKQGTMPENEAQTVVLDGSRTVYDIPEGHHPAGGEVRIYATEKRLTPSTTAQTYTSPGETVYTKIILDPIPDIYRDVSGADAEPGEVLSGAKFIGASGELETGEIDSKTGKQGTTVVSNGNKYIDKGYHDGTSYFTVNVPQEIASGEDSTSCTATASDVAQGKTFRSGGYLRTGTLPAAELPAISMSFDETDSSYLLVKGSVQIPQKSIAAAGQSTSGIAFVPKYKGATSVTPGSSQQTLSTAGKYVESDIVIGASSGGTAGKSAYYGEVTLSDTNLFGFDTKRFEQYSASKLSRIYMSSVSYGGGDYEIREFMWRNGNTKLTYWDAYSGKYVTEFNHSDVKINAYLSSIYFDTSGTFTFGGTYEIGIICDE
jgi:hypothetical protein